MRFVYPYETEQEATSVIVHFPDVPGATTQVDKGEDFDVLVRDCLIAALGGYIKLRQAPPQPSRIGSRAAITLDILLSAKLTLAMAMAEEKMSNVALAAQLGVNEKAVRRLVDIDHVSRIDRLESALRVFGLQLELSVTRPGGQHRARVTMGSDSNAANSNQYPT